MLNFRRAIATIKRAKLRAGLILLILLAIIWFYGFQTTYIRIIKTTPNNCCAPIPLPDPTKPVPAKIDTDGGNRNYTRHLHLADTMLSSNKPMTGDFTVYRLPGKTVIIKSFQDRVDTVTKSDSSWIAAQEKASKLPPEKRPPVSHMQPRPIFIDTVAHNNQTLTFVRTDYIASIHFSGNLYGWQKGPNSAISAQDLLTGKSISYAGINFSKSNIEALSTYSATITDCQLGEGTKINFDSKGSIYISGSNFKSSGSVLLQAPEIGLERCIINPGTNIVLNGLDTGKNMATKVTIRNTDLRASIISVAHADVELGTIKLDSVSSLTIGDALTIDSLYGPGKLKLIGRTYPDISVTRNGKLIDADYLVKVTLKNVDTAKLILPENGVNFLVDPEQPQQVQIKLFKFLISRYQDQAEKKKKYDIAYQKFLSLVNNDWLTDFLKENWNNYGYEKYLIFWNSMFLMLFFFSWNLLFFPKILTKGYTIREFETAERTIRTRYRNPLLAELRTIVNCFFYTIFIFWGLKLEVNKIKIYNLGFSFLILLQYLVGIVCLAYIANVILTR